MAKSKVPKLSRSEKAQLNSLRVLKLMRSGLHGTKSLTKLASDFSVTPRTVKKYGAGALYKTKGGIFAVKKVDSITRPEMKFFERGSAKVAGVITTNSKQSSKIGRYWNEVRRSLNGDYNELFKFKNKYVLDESGNRKYFETNEETVRTLWSSIPQTEYFHIYNFG